MKKNERYIWAGAVILADLVFFVMPLFAFFFAYVILVRPVWFKTWLDDIYSGE